ncbi:MAG: response regulator, partial [Crocinitomicaceae bacterium]|nr:response regulator [Crocinitomicaceae bacterium]
MDSLLTALVLDDEPKACRLLNSLLDEFCDEIGEVFVTTSWKEAINKLETEQPDILFLDIKMPSLNGFDFLNTAENHISKVIFTTAYSEYAIKAIKHGAFDYLLKPIQVDELKIAVQKAARDQKELNKNNLSSVLNLLQEKIVPRQSTLAIHDKGGLIFIKIDTIILL